MIPTPKSGDLPFPSNINQNIKAGMQYMPILEDFGFSNLEVL